MARQARAMPPISRYAVAWLPPANVLRSLPNRQGDLLARCRCRRDPQRSNLAGRDVPIVRVNEPDLTMRMTEYVVLHVLMHHRQQRRIDENQRRKIWDSFPTHGASRPGRRHHGARTSWAATRRMRLRDLGFKVAGWSRNRQAASRASIAMREMPSSTPFSHRTDILVSLLPHTPETDWHHQSRHDPQIVAQRSVWRTDHHQCRTRKAAGGRRYPRGARCRRASCSDARCVRDRAAAARRARSGRIPR